MRRLIWLLCLTLAFLIARPPAGLMDSLFNHFSAGRMRLATPSGTLWHGKGMLATSDGQRTLRAWRPVEWQTRLSLSRGGLMLTLGEHGQQQLSTTLTPSGLRLDQINIDLPLGVITSGIQHPIAKTGWRGSLNLTSPGLLCGWNGACEGSLRAEWASAALDILPNRPLGDHEIKLHAYGKTFEVSINTLKGDIRVSGTGTLDRQGRFQFEGFVEGDPEIVDNIPNIMERNAHLTDQSGRVRIVLP